MLAGQSPTERLFTLNKKTYAQQAKWFLDAFWTEKFEQDEAAREKVWQQTTLMAKIDKSKGKYGCSLPEIKAHIFLEKACEAVTWVDMRATLKAIDIDFDKTMSLSEFFVFERKLDWKKLVNATAFGGKAKKQLDDAQVKLEAAVVAQEQASADAIAAEEAASDAKEAESVAESASLAAETASEEAAAAKAAADKSHAQQAEVEKALRAVVEDITRQQTARNQTIHKLKKITENANKSTVAKGKAFQEMKALEGQDPLPLRKAKLTQKVMVKKQKKTTKRSLKCALKAKAKASAAAEAAAQAAAFAVQASDNRQSADSAAREAQTSLALAETAVNEATAALHTLQEASASDSGAAGTLWWMERELEDAKKYMPKSKFRALEKRMKKKMTMV